MRPPSSGGMGRMLTRARLADRSAGQVERRDRALRPEDVADADRDADRAGDPGGLGGVVDDRPPSWASPSVMRPKASPVWARPKPRAAPGTAGERASTDGPRRRRAMPSAPCSASTSAGLRRVTATSVSAAAVDARP